MVIERRSPIPILAALALIAAACGDADPAPEAAEPTLRDFGLADAPTATFGAFDGDEREIFTRVSGARFLSDGRVVVADMMSAQLRYFDPSGALLSTVGSQGEGPGEFRFIRTWGVMRGDTLVVFDQANRRLTYIDEGGEVASTAAVEAGQEVVVAGQAVASSPRNGWVLADGGVVVEPLLFTGTMAYGDDGLRSDTLPLFLYGPDGRHHATIGPVLAYEQNVLDGSVALRAFGARLQVAPLGDRVAVGNGREPRIALFDTLGSPAGHVDLDLEARPVTDAAVQVRRDRWLEMTGGREGAAAIFDVAPPPETLPYHEALLGDSDGRLWLRRYDVDGEGPSEWLALDRDLEPWGAVTIPARFELADASGADLLLIETDELDRQRVVQVAIEEAPEVPGG